MKIKFENLKLLFKNRKNLYIFLAIGILILVCGNFSSRDKTAETSTDGFISINRDEEKRLEALISKIDGAGNTNVMITYESGIERVALQNKKISTSAVEDSDKIAEGGKSEKETTEEWQAVMNGSGSSQTPFVSKEIFPKVRGVLVAAEGADDEKVCLDITNAVSAVLDVPYHRIKVLKKSK